MNSANEVQGCEEHVGFFAIFQRSAAADDGETARICHYLGAYGHCVEGWLYSTPALANHFLAEFVNDDRLNEPRGWFARDGAHIIEGTYEVL